MLTLFKKIFTWWNQDTFGTRLKTILFGKLVGSDNFGNKYYESKNGKLEDSLQSVNENELLNKLIEISKTKKKPLIVKNNNQKSIGVITQSDLLRAVVEGSDGE